MTLKVVLPFKPMTFFSLPQITNPLRKWYQYVNNTANGGASPFHPRKANFFNSAKKLTGLL